MKREAARHYRSYIQLASPEEREDVAEAKRYLDAYAEK
jgi:tRNA isopentenyl-2-thiomethyl-A-37 hydroxylase MiaE